LKFESKEIEERYYQLVEGHNVHFNINGELSELDLKDIENCIKIVDEINRKKAH